MSKVVTEIFRHFEMTIENPENPMKVDATLAFYLSGFNVGLKSRHSAEKMG